MCVKSIPLFRRLRLDLHVGYSSYLRSYNQNEVHQTYLGLEPKKDPLNLTFYFPMQFNLT